MATLLIITHLVAHPEHERGTAVQAVHDGADTAGALTPDLGRIVWRESVKRVWHDGADTAGAALTPDLGTNV